MRHRIEVLYTSPLSKDDLLGMTYSLVPEEIEVLRSSTRAHPGGIVSVTVDIAANPAETEAVVRAIINAPGYPPRDVTCRKMRG